jgi:hypothetical protein
VPIVEGHSEVEAVPVLLRRLLADEQRLDIKIARPVRTGRYKIVRPGELERAFQYARLHSEGCNAILLLLDADDDLPCELGPRLLMQAQQVAADLPGKVVLANREFESWFLGSIESLRGHRGIASDAVSLELPELPRDVKGHLTRLMTEGRTYVEVEDQPAFTAIFDIKAARNSCPSFDKLVRDLQALLSRL